MLRDALPARREARRQLVGTLFSSLGRGLTLPFLYIYLTEVRHLPGSSVGLAIGWFGLLTLLLSPLGGTLIDRYGARRVVLPALAISSIGSGSLALVGDIWQAFASLTVCGLGGAAIWAGQNTIMTTLTGEHERQRVFGLQFALLNLGIGIGSALAGTVVDVTRPGTFQFIYLADMLCYAGPFVILLTMPQVGRRLVGDEPTAAGPKERRGYAEVLRHRPFRRLMIFSVLLTVSGYAQLEVGFTGFATKVAGASTRIVGYSFTCNTIVIVLAQLLVIRLLQGRSRTRALMTVGVVFAAAWLVLGVAGYVDGRNTVISAIGVIAFGGIFAFGETLLSPINPALVNELASDELRGRYNALSAMVWGISAVIAPVSAGPLLAAGLGGVWIVLVAGGCLAASVVAYSLRNLITPEQDGLLTPAAPLTPAPTPA
ncbi:MFS transporter [Catellatospora tritici]|uniref:MFS transporter n=1 Tax=Catellatospora tritici TaxID=2851566 RepID=UPI001C2D9895|nr:MFS transporter [Catellatospora tritici]MBV1853326.1 MFS transporter [Catellatospora tritici]